MIEDARKLESGINISADLCVVGSSAAAIPVALEYMKTGKKVVILPGGGPNQTSSNIDLYRGKVDSRKNHEPLEENRLRMWGGTTSVWGGRCVPFDQIDFDPRSWVADSGWPISLDDLKPYISTANRLSEAGDAVFDAREVFPEKQAELLEGFDSAEFATWPLERWSIPIDFGKFYQKTLKSAENVRVLMHGHAIHLQLNKSAGTVEEVTAATRGKHRFKIKAKKVVIGCGALENARLLLASNDILPDGIGNEFDLVGRYYQSHRFGVCGYVKLRNPDKDFMYDFEKDQEGVYCRRRFWLTPEAQEKFKVCNVIGLQYRTFIRKKML